jgi:hypothetical protein
VVKRNMTISVDNQQNKMSENPTVQAPPPPYSNALSLRANRGMMITRVNNHKYVEKYRLGDHRKPVSCIPETVFSQDEMTLINDYLKNIHM